MLSRAQFESACQAFARRHPQWTWVAGHRPGYGYLTRSTVHARKAPIDPEDEPALSDLEIQEDDPATAQPVVSSLNVEEHIVYSASFTVPAFYFNIFDSSALQMYFTPRLVSYVTDGASLALADILQTSFFKVKPPRGSDATDFALTLPAGSFPLLSQGDHPTLGTPFWYFHPCETEAAVAEFMVEVKQPGWTEEERLTRWLELWLMIVGGFLNV